MFAYPFFALTWQQLKTGNNKLNIYTHYLMKSTFETIWLFVHRPVGLVELLISYARVQFYTPQASDYRLISKTANTKFVIVVKTLKMCTEYGENICYFQGNLHNRRHLQKHLILESSQTFSNCVFVQTYIEYQLYT